MKDLWFLLLFALLTLASLGFINRLQRMLEQKP